MSSLVRFVFPVLASTMIPLFGALAAVTHTMLTVQMVIQLNKLIKFTNGYVMIVDSHVFLVFIRPIFHPIFSSANPAGELFTESASTPR